MDECSGINSPEYWDQRFLKDWTENGGHLYTYAYAELLAEQLPDRFLLEIRRSKMSICDWGCAEGEAAAYLSQLFPNQKICGVDVSETAINNARNKFPHLEFMAQDWTLPGTDIPVHDVVFTSHVLEHFPNPMELLNKVLSRAARKMIIILVPYAEDPEKKDPEHFFRFLDSNLPLQWEGWSCVFFRVLDTRMRKGYCWHGHQALLVYAANDWVEKESITRFLSSFRGETDTLKSELEITKRKCERQELELALSAKKLEAQYLHDQLFARVNETLRSQVTSLNSQLATIKNEHSTLKNEHSTLKNEHSTLKNEHSTLKNEHSTLVENLNTLRSQLSFSAAQVSQLTHRNEQLLHDLKRIERTYLETYETLKSPKAVMLFYLGALRRKIKRGLQKRPPAISSRPVSTCAPPTPSETSSQSQSTESIVIQNNTSNDVSEKEQSSHEKAVKSAPNQPLLSDNAPDEKGEIAAEKEAIISGARKIISCPNSLSNLKVASILDTFSHSCFSPECALLPIRPMDWQACLEHDPVDMLLVESAWHGNDDAWQYRIASYASPAGNELNDLLRWCNRKNIPTVFWNKEDPPNYDRFIDAASMFDYIFTTDENCVDAYRKRCGHDRVYPLPFAAQPAIHNPVITSPRLDKVCFAGTYYADCFPERRRHMENMLAGSIVYGLDIYDRMHGHQGNDAERFAFPEQFRPYIQGKLAYDAMLDAYRKYRVFLNVNSVQDSPTMFARRVYELLACGTPVISTPSLGMHKIFGDLIAQVTTADETRKALQRLMEDELCWIRSSALGIRTVMGEHTYGHRLKTICLELGRDLDSRPPRNCAVVVLPLGKPEHVVDNILCQSIKPHSVIVLDGIQAAGQHHALLHHAGINARLLSLATFEETLQAESTLDTLAIFDSRHEYGPKYLGDALDALYYSKCTITGMDTSFRGIDENTVSLVKGQDEVCVIHNSPLIPTIVCDIPSFSNRILSTTADVDRIKLQNKCFMRMPFEFIHYPTETISDVTKSKVFI